MMSLRIPQKGHSERMRMLAASRFNNPESESTNMGRRLDNGRRDMEHLETVALFMVTGAPGDVVASAFEKTEAGLGIVLAKNDNASDKDKEYARYFSEYFENPSDEVFLGYLPSLISRSSQNLKHRVNKLGNLSVMIRSDLSASIESYFPDRGQDLKKFWVRTGSTEVYGVKQTLHKILDICQSKPKIAQNSASHRLLEELILAASALKDSKFFPICRLSLSSRRPLAKNGEELLSKFWRNLDKPRQYLHIERLIEFINEDKRRKFTIRWVPKEISVPKHIQELRKIDIEKVQTVTIELGKRHTKITKTEAEVEEMFASRSLNWEKDRAEFCETKTITPKLHAEIQIILALGKPMARSSSNVVKPQRAIGCSKSSCLQCWLYMKKVNELLNEEWMTAGDHSWPYETAALTGCHPTLDPDGLCDKYIMETVQSYAIRQVKQLYGLQPVQPFHKRKSDEYATASGESDSDSRSESGAKPQNLGKSIHK
ncbi:hypothetical protein J132_09046 [Termitomyces sp. J132]|nr:hypothetical protein H2248_000227 [Termitomyces sp. 'cryptogamus']KNZ71529.1 hypothetical protein J132_09046 [Termitomyces sp. J132]